MTSIPSDHPLRIGLIGLGLMGQALVQRFVAGGFEVLGWDLDEGSREALKEKGGMVGESGADVFSGCERVVLSLPDSRVVSAVLREAPLRAGQIVIDTSTGDPDDAVEIARWLAERGVHYLDATVSGSSVQLVKGTATLMIGGEAEVMARCGDVFESLAKTIFHVGEAGNGARMKLVTNLVLGVNRAALAEGLTLAGVLGLDLKQTLEVMQGSMAYSRIMDTKGVKMIEADFTPQAKLTQHLKDVRLMIAAARAAEVRLPLSEAHQGLLERAEAMGFGEMDNSAVIRAYS
jgi:3-hydroxyisobutyrate dehydrogenase-like beta-hydroxyacid dehydrogenase